MTLPSSCYALLIGQLPHAGTANHPRPRAVSAGAREDEERASRSCSSSHRQDCDMSGRRLNSLVLQSFSHLRRLERQPSGVFELPTSPLQPVPAPEPELVHEQEPNQEVRPDDWTSSSTIRAVCTDCKATCPVRHGTSARNPDRQLAQLVADGREESILECLAAGADVNALHDLEDHYFPITALMLATITNRPSIVQLLIGAGANAEVESRYGTAIEMACRFERLECLEALANAGADLEKKGAKSRTLLMKAAVRGTVDLVRVLISAGADREAHDSCHRTPFILACTRGHVEVVAELLRAGCNVSATASNGADGLQLAAALGHCAVANLLTVYRSSDMPDPTAPKQPQGRHQPTPVPVSSARDTEQLCDTVVRAPDAGARCARLAPRGSWSLQLRDTTAASLPRPESQEGTVLHFLCTGAGRARG